MVSHVGADICEGLATGLPFSPAIVNIYIEYFEEIELEITFLKPAL